MNDLSPLTGSGNQPLKSFWEKREGTTGMIVLALLGVAGVMLFNTVSPMIIGALTGVAGILSALTGIAVKGIMLTISGAVLVGLLFILTNRKFLILVSYGFKMVMRRLTSIFVATFPIDIMEGYIDSMINKKEEIDQNVTKLSGEKRICKNQIDDQASQIDKCMFRVKVAKEKGMNAELSLASREAGRLKDSNERLQKQYTQIDFLYKVLLRYQEAADIVIKDLQSEVKVRKSDQRIILASHSAMKGAKAIINGVSTEKELFDQACEYQAEDYGRKMGEIDDFMESSKGFIEGLDLQNGVYEEQALAQLKAWENKTGSILLGDDKRVLLENMTISSPTIQLGTLQAVPKGAGDDYQKFFAGKQ